MADTGDLRQQSGYLLQRFSEWLRAGCLCVVVSSSKKTNGLGPAGEGRESGAGCEQASAKYLECMDTARGSKAAARSSHSHAEIQTCAGPVPPCPPSALVSASRALTYRGWVLSPSSPLILTRFSIIAQHSTIKLGRGRRRVVGDGLVSLEGRMGPEGSGGEPEGGPLQAQRLGTSQLGREDRGTFARLVLPVPYSGVLRGVFGRRLSRD